MPLIKQKMIYRSDLCANRHVLYLFGDNEERIGYAGQAKEMRDEPNARGVRTKRRPGMHPEDFWTDGDYVANVAMIHDDLLPAFDYLANGGLVVVPLDGLGTGLSRLDQYAPKTLAFLNNALHNMRMR